MKIMKKKLKSSSMLAFAMIVPSLIGFAVFSLGPLVYILRYAFYYYDGIKMVFVGMQNFIDIFQNDSIYWVSMLNTFIFTFGKLIVEIPLAIFLATLINKNIRGSKFFRGIFFLPNVLSTSIVALLFGFLFGTVNGVVNNVLLELGIIDSAIDWLGETRTAMMLLMFVSVWQNFGINMLLFYAGLQNIPNEMYEAAKIDGANETRIFFKITVPMLAPTLKTVLMLAIIGSMTMTDLVLVFTNGGPLGSTTVGMLYVFQTMMGTVDRGQQIGYGSALGILTAIILWITIFFYKKAFSKVSEE